MAETEPKEGERRKILSTRSEQSKFHVRGNVHMCTRRNLFGGCNLVDGMPVSDKFVTRVNASVTHVVTIILKDSFRSQKTLHHL